MRLKILFACMMVVFGWLESSAGTAPVKIWNKVLSQSCYFSAIKGDTVVAVTDRIVLLSKDGQIISQSPVLDDLQNLSDGRYSFEFLKDNTVLLLKDKYIIRKIGLTGETLWFKNLRDTVPGVACNDLLEEKDGILYLCGDVNYQAGFLAKISQNGIFLFCKKYDAFGSFYAITVNESTLYLSISDLSMYFPSKLVSFDTIGNFIKTLNGKCNANNLLFRKDHIISLGIQDGVALFKKAFFATRDITLRKYDSNGALTDTVLFDFGKYETPVDIIGQKDGFIMVTISDETVNMGTNYLNYFVTKIDDNLVKEWQFKFGTDTSGINGITSYRSYYADEMGCVLAVHNDTLCMYKIPPTETITIKKVPVVITRDSREFDLCGRLLRSSKAPSFPPAPGFLLETNGTGFKKKILVSGMKTK
ncbi:MAG: hypothetical protein GX640_12725 [Fibrobacter sp.]|nr:hypothetical protein [Fibrobacter sp.]